MQRVDSLNLYSDLVRQAKSKTSVSNCVLLPGTVSRLVAECRLFYVQLTAGVAFYISENDHYVLQLITDSNTPIYLPDIDDTVLCSLLFHENKNNNNVEQICSMLKVEGFFVYRSSRRMQLNLDTVETQGFISEIMDDTISISSPRSVDLPEILALWEETLHRGIYDIPDADDLCLDNVVCIIRENCLLGAALCTMSKKEAILEHVAVVPTQRRRGYGSLLVDACLHNLKKRNISRCTLWLEKENINAEKMYLKHGFEFTSISSVQMIKEKENGE